jgi:hypothetical protein
MRIAQMLLKPNKTYLYSHSTPAGSVFYIGVGAATRPFEFSRRKRSKEWWRLYEAHGVRVSIVEEFESNGAAYAAEIELIRKYRAEGHPLINVTGGGRGMKGVKPWNAEKVGVFGAEALKKISNSTKQRFSAPEAKSEHAVRCGGRPFRAIQISTQSVAWTGVNQSECARELGLNQGNINNCLRNPRRTHKGYRFELIEETAA